MNQPLAEPPLVIAPGRAVAFHLEVRFQDGFVALSTFDGEPIRCIIGDGTLTPGIESIIRGLAPGRDTHVVANGSDLFAPYDASNRHWLDCGDFPTDLVPTPGQVVAFTTPGGQEVGGLILAAEERRVEVDFNHPLAGRDLTIRVKVLSVS